MNVLLLGGSGQLGTEIRRSWGAAISAPSSAEVPLNDPVALQKAITSTTCDVVVNCAAFHNVDACESDVQRAFETNAVAVSNIAKLCAETAKTFVTVSTDYVFDGEAVREYSESDVPNPVQAYGVSKYAGEMLAQNALENLYVIRTCGLYGRRPSSTKGYTFVDRIIRQAQAGEALRIVSDVVASPTYAGHLATAIEHIIKAAQPGIYHVANRGPVSWYDFAVEALRQAGIDHPIEPISAGEWKAAARRPRFSALGSERLAGLGLEMPDWREGIAAYLRERDLAD